MHEVARILDANANRAREAMRVMEDAVRFLLDDVALSERLKGLRHDFAAAVGGLPGGVALELHRDTPGDVGTRLTTEAERTRSSVHAVVVAAGKRLSEALRAMEEYGKLIDPEFAGKIEGLRYRGYAIESDLHRRFGSMRRRQWRVCVLISEGLCERRDWLGVAEACMEGGADCLQLREKDLEAGELLARAEALVALARQERWEQRPSVIINDRPDVALLSGADGVHLGQTDLPCGAVRRLVGRGLLVGVSTSNLAQARQAAADGADYCGVGPMFPTTTKHKPVLAGPGYLKQFVEALPTMPHLAIGGITPENVGELAVAGGRGVAVSAVACKAGDPGAVVRKLRAGLGGDEGDGRLGERADQA